MKNGKKSARRYVKSTIQLEKERERRRKLRVIVLKDPRLWTLTQVELAKKLGYSQAIVSRDLAKLVSSKWNPFRQLE